MFPLNQLQSPFSSSLKLFPNHLDWNLGYFCSFYSHTTENPLDLCSQRVSQYDLMSAVMQVYREVLWEIRQKETNIHLIPRASILHVLLM